MSNGEYPRVSEEFTEGDEHQDAQPIMEQINQAAQSDPEAARLKEQIESAQTQAETYLRKKQDVSVSEPTELKPQDEGVVEHKDDVEPQMLKILDDLAAKIATLSEDDPRRTKMEQFRAELVRIYES
ncbi:hypothetical protein KKH43_01165 [Patescibacteria group bacterium]|nr:hypothetical protein [Patescibacteria group bacterium]